MEMTPRLSLSKALRLPHIFNSVYRISKFLRDLMVYLEDKISRCGSPQANILYMLWSCPKLEHYWREVVSIINMVSSVNIILAPFVCLLGYVEDLSTADYEKVSVALIYGKEVDISALIRY